MHIKLTDFGSAKILVTEGIAQPENTNMSTKERKNSFVGTAEYCSPELLDGRQESAKSDVWAFGCVLFKLITSHLPFKGGSEYLTFQLVLAQSITFPKTIDKEAKDLISKILIKDTDKRLNLDQVKSHPFFGLIDWTRLIDSESPAIGYEYGKKKESNHASLSNECIDKFSHNLPHQSTTTATHPTATQPTTQPTDTPTHPSTQPVSTTTPSPAMNESTLSSLNTFATNHYSHLLKKDELIIKYGLVIRKQLLINSKYLLFLTSIKRILLVDSTSYIVRKELFVKVNATLKSKDCFIISSGEKEYVMRLPTNNAHEWVYCVNKTFSDCV